MTIIEAEFIKNLRVTEKHSWKQIAEIYIETFGGPDILHNDIKYGKELCNEAAKCLGEKQWD